MGNGYPLYNSWNPKLIDFLFYEIFSYCQDSRRDFFNRILWTTVLCYSESRSRDAANLLLGLHERNLKDFTDDYYKTRLTILGDLQSLKGDKEYIQRLLNIAANHEISSRVRLDACECILKLIGRI